MDQDANENPAEFDDVDEYDDTNLTFQEVAEVAVNDALSAFISEMNSNISELDFYITMGGDGILPHFFIEHTCFEVAIEFMGRHFYYRG